MGKGGCWMRGGRWRARVPPSQAGVHLGVPRVAVSVLYLLGSEVSMGTAHFQTGNRSQGLRPSAERREAGVTGSPTGRQGRAAGGVGEAGRAWPREAGPAFQELAQIPVRPRPSSAAQTTQVASSWQVPGFLEWNLGWGQGGQAAGPHPAHGVQSAAGSRGAFRAHWGEQCAGPRGNEGQTQPALLSQGGTCPGCQGPLDLQPSSLSRRRRSALSEPGSEPCFSWLTDLEIWVHCLLQWCQVEG